MKKAILFMICMICQTTTLASIFAPIPLPSADPWSSVTSGSDIMQNIRQRQLQNQLLQEQIAMMQQQRAAMQTENTRRLYKSNNAIDEYANDIDFSKIFSCLEKNRIGQITSWRDSETGSSYIFIPTKNVIYEGNPYCREYRLIIKAGKKRHEQHRTACRQPNGSWTEEY